MNQSPLQRAAVVAFDPSNHVARYEVQVDVSEVRLAVCGDHQMRQIILIYFVGSAILAAAQLPVLAQPTDGDPASGRKVSQRRYAAHAIELCR